MAGLDKWRIWVALRFLQHPVVIHLAPRAVACAGKVHTSDDILATVGEPKMQSTNNALDKSSS